MRLEVVEVDEDGVNSFILEVDESDTIAHVKIKIQNQEGIPVHIQHVLQPEFLRFLGSATAADKKVLAVRDDTTLAELSIVEGSPGPHLILSVSDGRLLPKEERELHDLLKNKEKIERHRQIALSNIQQLETKALKIAEDQADIKSYVEELDAVLRDMDSQLQGMMDWPADAEPEPEPARRASPAFQRGMSVLSRHEVPEGETALHGTRGRSPAGDAGGSSGAHSARSAGLLGIPGSQGGGTRITKKRRKKKKHSKKHSRKKGSRKKHSRR